MESSAHCHLCNALLIEDAGYWCACSDICYCSQECMIGDHYHADTCAHVRNNKMTRDITMILSNGEFYGLMAAFVYKWATVYPKGIVICSLQRDRNELLANCSLRFAQESPHSYIADHYNVQIEYVDNTQGKCVIAFTEFNKTFSEIICAATEIISPITINSTTILNYKVGAETVIAVNNCLRK